VRDIQSRLSSQFGDAAYSLQSVQRLCLYIWQGCEFLNDETRSGRQPIDSLDIQTLFSLEKTTFSFGLVTFRDPQSVAHGNCEPFARLDSAQIVPFAVDSSPVDRAAPGNNNPEMRGVVAIAREYGGE
jgi:hypothetical protein